MRKDNSLLQQKLSKPLKLPALAKNIHVLMQSLADENMDYRQLAEVIRHYPDITARIIFLVNSPWSAPISPVNNIEQACSRLGVPIVKSISIALSIASSFDTKKCPLFSTVYFWTTSMLVVEGATMLASKLPNHISSLEFKQTAQTAGILHNLGLLWLADNFPIETDKALQMIIDEPYSLSVSDSLKQCTGTDYCEVGGWIAKQLGFPEVLVTPIEYHLNPDYQESSWEIALLIGSAARMVSALHKQADEISTDSRLELLGLNPATQKLIYQKLSMNFEKNLELAKILF
ncbi:MAG: HDOD domain-containing protein [Methylococcales bacterium]|nr:HDOD domain-containing protein [Methylococcales bacterium]